MLAHRSLARCTALLLTVVLEGCVTPIPVREQAITPTYAGQGTLLVAVVDERYRRRLPALPPGAACRA
jgi:hypothetical protein